MTATRRSSAQGVRIRGIDDIRAHFPALDARARRPLGGVLRWTRAARRFRASVVDAMRGYLLHHNANTHWAYPTSIETDARHRCRARGRSPISSTPATNEIAFGANMTTLTFSLSRALAPPIGRGR